MLKSHRPYSPEFRQRIVELVQKGRTPSSAMYAATDPRLNRSSDAN
jgi:transposase-like protein